MNNVVLIGRLAKDPELRFTQGKGTAVCTFNLAVDREGQEGADFIRVTAWNKTAELITTYLTKGSQCAIQGRISARSYKDSNDETKYITEVVANRVEFLSPKSNKSNVQQQKNDNPFDDFNAVDDDDLPF